jgi:hypothetical protein
VGEYPLGDGLELHSFLPKSAIEAGVECAVDLEERVDVGERQLAFIVGEEAHDHEKDFRRKLEERHRDRIEVEMWDVDSGSSSEKIPQLLGPW